MSTCFDDRPVRCLLTHSCSHDHALSERIRGALGANGLLIDVDPFPPGVGIVARIETLSIDVLLFLISPESWSSHWCREELAAARRRGIPVLLLRARGSVPPELQAHISFDLTSEDERSFDEATRQLALAIHARARLHRLVVAAGPDAFPDVSHAAAQSLADEADAAVLAEFVESIGARLRDGSDPVTQAALARALGEAGTQRAAEMVCELMASLPSDSHPLVRYALEDARERLPWKLRKNGMC